MSREPSMTGDDMAALHCACFGHMRPWTAGEIAGLLASPHAFALTRPNAFLLGRCVAGEAEIITLAVSPAARRQGLGRALVQEFLAHAQKAGAEAAFLEVAADNAPAIALYQAAGFAKAGLRRAYYHLANGGCVDGLTMTCPILPRFPKI